LAHFVEFDRYLMPATGTAGRWVATLGAACAIALTYFLAAQVGLSLLAKPSDVAVFWPASGIAAGILVAAGRRVGVALVVGVVVGTIAANLMSDRSLSTSILKGFCNAGEAALLAWLLDRWFGRPFSFCDLRRVGGFFTAVGIAVSISAVGGAAITTTLQTAAPFWDVWRTLFLSDAVGILVVAPLLIELGQVTIQRRSRAELIEGAGTVVLIALASIYAVTFPTGTWLSFDSDAIVFPMLLWLAARNQQPFAIAGAFAISIAVIAATTYGVGHFGDVTLAIVERAQGAQVVATMVTAFTLVLTAIFAERSRSENTLRQREAELGEAQRLAHIGSWYWDAETDVVVASNELLRIFGLDPAADAVLTLSGQRGRCYPDDDWKRLKAAVQRAMETGVGYELELRAFRNETPIWITARGAAARNANGRIVGLRGTVQDVTERKRVELALAQRNTQIELASKAARVGSLAIDLHSGLVKLSPGCATIFGLPESTLEMSRDDANKIIHPDDLASLELRRDQALLKGQREIIAQFRIRRADDSEVRWIEARSVILYDQDGKPAQMIGVRIDINDRKLAADILAERNLQLELAGMVGRVGSYAYDVNAEKLQVSEGYAALHGLPEGTTEIALGEWQARVHPEDLDRVEGVHNQAVADKRRDYSVEYRIVRSNGEVRWTERRCSIVYDGDARPQRVVGVSIDITQRKQAETLIKEGKSRLADALTAGQVIAFEWSAVPNLIQRSDNAIDILGRNDQDAWVGSRQNDFLIHVHPDDRASLETRIRELCPRSPSYAVTFRYVRPDSRTVWLEETARGEFDTTGKLSRVKGLTRDITERKRAEERQCTLIAELDHRVKNTLATVNAVISQTRQGSRSVADFATALEGRLRSMAATHELLSARRWSGISLANLVSHELAPYANRNNTEINGPYVALRPEAGQAMAMVIHELATNAAKYGALSTRKGRVSIRWDRRLNGRPRSDLVLEWQEIGGPPVSAPGNSGYGTSTIRDLIPYEFGGTADLVFAPEGVQCRLELPADWLSDAAHPSSGAVAGAAAK
jgi:PAS domain S-box-containing protein